MGNTSTGAASGSRISTARALENRPKRPNFGSRVSSSKHQFSRRYVRECTWKAGGDWLQVPPNELAYVNYFARSLHTCIMLNIKFQDYNQMLGVNNQDFVACGKQHASAEGPLKGRYGVVICCNYMLLHNYWLLISSSKLYTLYIIHDV